MRASRRSRRSSAVAAHGCSGWTWSSACSSSSAPPTTSRDSIRWLDTGRIWGVAPRGRRLRLPPVPHSRAARVGVQAGASGGWVWVQIRCLVSHCHMGHMIIIQEPAMNGREEVSPAKKPTWAMQPGWSAC